MKTFALLLASIGLLLSSSAADRISDADHILKPLVGVQVIAEGIAWGEGDKGLGERITLPSGQKVYLAGLDFRKNDLCGRLIRVMGKFRIRHQKAASGMSQGYSSDFAYYQIEVSECSVIDKVTLGFPRADK